MKLSELLFGMDVKEIHADLTSEITGVCYDSRQCEPGQLFVAISGFAQDGHRFISAALQKGAAVIVCERIPKETCDYVLVDSARLALAQLGANWFDHPADKMKIIAVTGTNGKTTSTYLLKNVLESTLGVKVGLIGTIQNMIGEEVLHTERTTPESFELHRLFAQMYEAGCSYVVMEVSSHALVLERVGAIHFEVGAFTNLTEDHLDFHKTMEAYAEAKAMLFRRCTYGAVNTDDVWAEQMMRDSTCTMLTYGIRSDAQLKAENISLYSNRVELDACFEAQRCHVNLAIPGGFTAYNCLTVIASALQLGLPLDEICEALGKAKGVKGRVEVIPTPGTEYTVLADYAHTPDALENVLTTVKGFCKGRVIALFGCGGDRDPIKRPIMGKIGVDHADYVIITSDNPRTEDPNAIIADILKGIEGSKTPYIAIENRPEAIFWAMSHAQKDDIIVLAGKGHEDYQEINHVKHHLDEREVVAECLARLTQEG